jgi:putative DNA primase/helicase
VLSGFEAVGVYLRDAAFRAAVRVDGLPEPDVLMTSGLAVVEVDERREGAEMGNVKEKLVGDDEGGEGRPRRRSSKRGVPQRESAAAPTSSTSSEPDPAARVDAAAAPSSAAPASVSSSATPAAADPPRFAPTRPPVGEPLFGLDDVPHEIKALAEHRFGSPLRMGVPRENGGPYRGEVLNTEHYLIQSVATRSVVFHRKDQMMFVSERLKWMDENARLNGSELQVGYEGERPKVYPWDRARDLLERTVASLKKSAQELNYSPNVEVMLDQMQARSWARVREARAAVAEKSKEQAASREVDGAGTDPDR